MQRLAGPAYYGKNYDRLRHRWHKVHLHTLCGTRLMNVLADQDIWVGSIPYEDKRDIFTDSTVLLPKTDIRIIEYLDYFRTRHPLVPVRVSAYGAWPRTEDTKKFRLLEESAWLYVVPMKFLFNRL